MNKGFMSRWMPYIWRADDKKPPKGFEKFFKRKEERQADTQNDQSNLNFWLIPLKPNLSI